MKYLILSWVFLCPILCSRIPRPFSQFHVSKLNDYFLTFSNLAILQIYLNPTTANAAQCRKIEGKSCQCDRCISIATAEGPWYNPYNQRIFDTSRSSYLPSHPENYLSKELGDRNIIIIGEIHSNPCHHRVEFDIIKTLATTNSISSSNLAIGLEAFYRQHQNILDDFVFNHKDFNLLKTQSKWNETWGYDLNYYSKILRYASANEIRLIGLNLPHPIARFVSQNGLDHLPDSVKPYLPEVDLGDAEHRKQFDDAMAAAGVSAHLSHDNSSMGRLYQTQCLWDEYMAESASIYLNKHPEKTLVVIAGEGHVLGRTGIPNRIHKRVRGSQPFIIVPVQVDWLPNGLPDIDLPLSKADCDWAWYTEKEIVSA